MRENNSTIRFYDDNAAAFAEGTLMADMSVWRNKFMSYLPAGGVVLDAGCGSGRDCKVFMEKGFRGAAFDASEEMCRVAGQYLGMEVRQLRFEELDYREAFDGIWACASLLHVAEEDLPHVMDKLAEALKPGGHMYVSFKYGEGETVKGERHFTNMTPDKLEKLTGAHSFRTIEAAVTQDVRESRRDEKWVNAIVRKV